MPILHLMPGVGVENLMLGMPKAKSRQIIETWFNSRFFEVVDQAISPPLMSDLYHEGVVVRYDDENVVNVIEIQARCIECCFIDTNISSYDGSSLKEFMKTKAYKMKKLGGINAYEDIGFGFSNNRKGQIDFFYIFRPNYYHLYVEEVKKRGEKRLSEYMAKGHL